MTEIPPQPDKPLDEITYKGIAIEGLGFLESKNLAQRGEIFSLIDKLPPNFAEFTMLGRIVFDSRKHFTVERNGKVSMVDEERIKPEDKILRRGRGVTVWNNEVIDERLVPTDGKQTITIFSTENWEGETSSDVTKYALAHELGHVLWMAIEEGPQIWKGLQEAGRITQAPDTEYFLPLINAWKELPESALPRFLDYKKDIIRERVRYGIGESYEDDALLQIEDFAVANEYYLYWENLISLDEDRSGLIGLGYELMAKPS